LGNKKKGSLMRNSKDKGMLDRLNRDSITDSNRSYQSPNSSLRKTQESKKAAQNNQNPEQMTFQQYQTMLLLKQE
jgi:hypothetical protein